MASHSELDKFLHKLSILMKESKVNVASIIFHPPNTPGDVMAVGIIGNPNLDWCVGAGEQYYKQLALAIKNEKVTSNRINPNVGTPIEMPSNIIIPPRNSRVN